MENTDVSEGKLISEFNEAKFQIFRLHNIWVDLRNLREKGNLVKINWILDSAQLELATDANRLDENIKEEEKKYSSKLKKLDEEILKSFTSADKKELYKYLKEKETLLRILQQDAGKGGRLRDADDDGF